jgi:hypothetical protein
LHHLRGIEIAAIATAVPSSTAVAKATAIAATEAAAAVAQAAASVAAASVNLRKGVANAHSEGHGHRAHRYHAIQSHRMFFVVFGFVWFSWMRGLRNRSPTVHCQGRRSGRTCGYTGHWEKVSKQSRLQNDCPAQTAEVL